MKQKKNQNRHELTLDQFFKYGCEAYFTKKNFEVHTEKELITGAKRVDAVLKGRLGNNQMSSEKWLTATCEAWMLSMGAACPQEAGLAAHPAAKLRGWRGGNGATLSQEVTTERVFLLGYLFFLHEKEKVT